MKHRVVLLGFFVLVLVLAGAAYAAENGYSVDWWTVDGGGGVSQGGGYTLQGTIGQPDAGEVMSSGDYSVVGGFWGGAIIPSYGYIYLPLVIR